MARSFVLADTDRLHAKIVAMSDRIRQLEDGLALLHDKPEDPHPLLARDLLELKSMIDLHSAVDRPPPDETQPAGAEDDGGGAKEGDSEEEEEVEKEVDVGAIDRGAEEDLAAEDAERRERSMRELVRRRNATKKYSRLR